MTNSAPASVQFVEMIREEYARIVNVSSRYEYCPKDGRETRHELSGHTANGEIYKCVECGAWLTVKGE